MSLPNSVNVVRQGSPEFTEGLTTNAVILLCVSYIALTDLQLANQQFFCRVFIGAGAEDNLISSGHFYRIVKIKVNITLETNTNCLYIVTIIGSYFDKRVVRDDNRQARSGMTASPLKDW